MASPAPVPVLLVEPRSPQGNSNPPPPGPGATETQTQIVGGNTITTTVSRSSTPPTSTLDVFLTTGTPPANTTSPSSGLTSSGQGVNSSPDGLGSGAVAGVAIGCLIAGIAVGAILAMWLLRHRRNRPDESQYMLQHSGADAKDPNAYPMSLSSPVSGPDPFRLDQILPAPMPDDVVAGELRNLGRLIGQHVVDNYHREAVPVDQPALARALVDLGLGAGADVSTGQLAALAASPQARCTALQHIIARAVTGSVVLSSTVRFSLLPASMAAFMKELAPTERDRGSAKAVSAAFARWRQISTFLINPHRSERTPLLPNEAATAPKARELVAALNAVLAPFVDPNQVEAHRQEGHLYDVVMECARFGHMLVSQPGEFRLRWDAGPAADQTVVVVCPGLDKIGDEHGTRYSPSRTLLAPATETVN